MQPTPIELRLLFTSILFLITTGLVYSFNPKLKFLEGFIFLFGGCAVLSILMMIWS